MDEETCYICYGGINKSILLKFNGCDNRSLYTMCAPCLFTYLENFRIRRKGILVIRKSCPICRQSCDLGIKHTHDLLSLDVSKWDCKSKLLYDLFLEEKKNTLSEYKTLLVVMNFPQMRFLSTLDPAKRKFLSCPKFLTFPKFVIKCDDDFIGDMNILEDVHYDLWDLFPTGSNGIIHYYG